ncbi:hypothetical protein HPB48_007389 [Haemaphysalis longicornis]|uniref:Uncharacterized protein n=1 Tax=Haemaphysalis longicornis TaxID=44386 RepID=A0A9J6G424_HAELO|nr:hypothetical protein HPB48_007389 [Haemaphysalis longicornis]
MRIKENVQQVQPPKMSKPFGTSGASIAAEQFTTVLSLFTCHTEQSPAILTCYLNMRRFIVKLVSRLLTREDKDQHRVGVCQQVRRRAGHGPPVMSRIITGDKTLIYGYGPEAKLQSSQWRSPRYA